MRKGYQRAKWQMRAETLHRKAQALAEDIEATDGDLGLLSSYAHDAAASTMQLAEQLKAKDA